MIWSRLLPAVLVLLLLGGTAGADSIPWSYSTFVFPTFVSPDPGAIGTAPGAPFGPWSVGVYFQGISGYQAGSSSIYFASWWAAGTTATFAHQPIQFDIGILDQASNRSQVALFTGYLDGTISAGQTNLALSYASPSQSLHIGSNTYRITLGALTATSAYGGSDPLSASGPMYPQPFGTVDATVQVQSSGPEPSSLVLLGVGASLAGIVYRRLRRQGQPAADA
jgi:hypothetical protein